MVVFVGSVLSHSPFPPSPFPRPVPLISLMEQCSPEVKFFLCAFSLLFFFYFFFVFVGGPFSFFLFLDLGFPCCPQIGPAWTLDLAWSLFSRHPPNIPLLCFFESFVRTESSGSCFFLSSSIRIEKHRLCILVPHNFLSPAGVLFFFLPQSPRALYCVSARPFEVWTCRSSKISLLFPPVALGSRRGPHSPRNDPPILDNLLFGPTPF